MSSAPAGLMVRDATEADLPRVVELINNGAVGGREGEQLGPPLPASYIDAFNEITERHGGHVFVAELNGEIVGTVQMLLLPNLSHLGRPIAQLESMHVAATHRGNRIGEEMIRCAVAEAKLHGCFRMQLTSNKLRHDAHRFYKRLGFEASHEGFKLSL